MRILLKKINAPASILEQNTVPREARPPIERKKKNLKSSMGPGPGAGVITVLV